MRIEDYGLIGDMQAAALVSRDGVVDWLCLPRFDSASCFSALVGDERHGRWLLAPSSPVRAATRRYRHDTLIVESIFALPGIGRLLIGAIQARDFIILQGVVLFVATGFVVVNFVVDMLYAVLDPRIRHGRA